MLLLIRWFRVRPPGAPPANLSVWWMVSWNHSWNHGVISACHAVMAATPSGHIEQLPSGSFRVHVYGGIDPITRKRIYFRKTAKTLTQAQIELGKLLEQ